MRLNQVKGARRTRARIATFSAAVVAGALIPALAFGAHGLATLPGSNFEIDDNANLKLDHAAPSVDWGSLSHAAGGPETRAQDEPTGQDDDSYKGGVKEDTECPAEVTGSIPNNKSDLLTFHVYEEAGTGGHPGFFNMAWSRVSDPSGTTLMDFEFNQSTVACAQGPNKQRTIGDLLIEYSIVQGGARAELSARTWLGTAWDDPIDIDAPSEKCPDGDAGNDANGVDLGPCAVGTINNTTIPADDSDGLGEKQARTFGEAQIDLRFLFEPNKCRSFGSAMVKSRSSDAFTSQLKDFISPVPITLQNCGQVIIRKETDPDGASASFGYTKAFSTDPTTGNTFTLQDGGKQDYGKTVLFGTGYTVTEDVIPSGWDFDRIDCSASVGFGEGDSEIGIAGAKISFAIDSADDVLDCTYYNKARAKLTVVKQVNDPPGGQGFDFTSTTLTPASFTLTPTGTGAAGADQKVFGDLAPSTYDVSETEPADWNLVSATCNNGDTPDAVTLDAGDDVTCTFVNERETGAIKITKTRKHAAAQGGEGPHEGVTFTITGGGLPQAGVEVVTNGNGVACYDGLLDGDYTVTESVPTGYAAVDAEKSVSVADESECGDGNEATVDFENIPLTNITVSVDSEVDGGTSSTIVCTDEDGNVSNGSTGADGDGSLTVEDLLPTDQTTTPPTITLTCEVYVDP